MTICVAVFRVVFRSVYLSILKYMKNWSAVVKKHVIHVCPPTIKSFFRCSFLLLYEKFKIIHDIHSLIAKEGSNK